MRYHQGKFKPRNPEKYRGDVNNITYRSSWELKLLMRLDNHQDVVYYSSEETVIPYRSPIDSKTHRYFVDFLVKVKQKDGKTKVLLIEVKPKAQTIPPIITESKTKSKKYINQVLTWAVNQAKWSAAEKYALDHGYEFVIFTEKELNIK